ncbi:12764_t:CDS:2, partial [Acaulospora colombiana]
QVIPSSIYREDNRLRYGSYSLMDPYFPNDAISCISESLIAYIDKGRVIIIDYYHLISQIRSQPGFTGIVEIWRNDWLETLERYGEAYHKHNVTRTPTEAFIRNTLQSIGCIKSYGALEDVLGKIEEGAPGLPLKDRVKYIREDKELMNALRRIWIDDSVS